MELSIVICTYNRSSFLRDGLEAIVKQLLTCSDASIEIIVVDNNSSDDTRAIVEQFQNRFSSLSLVYVFEKVQGLSFARNSGIENAKCKFIAFVDDDAVVNENWLSSLFQVINNTNAHVFGGPIYPRFEIPCPDWIDPNYFVRKFKKNDGFLNSMAAIDGFSGGNMCIKKEIFEAIGYFDTNLGMKGDVMGLGEESELFYRLSESSYIARLYNVEDMSISHFEAAEKLKPLYLKNRILLSGQQSANRFIQRDRFLGFFLVLFKLMKQLLFSFYYLIQIPFFKTSRFKFLKCIWIVRGLIKGVLHF